MSVWRRGPLAQNPYARTAFRVARVPRETVKHKTLVQLIGQTRKVVKTDPRAHVVGGRPVSVEELNAADQVMLDPRRRVLEELLEHATERPYLERFRKLEAEAGELLSSGSGPLPLTNPQALAPLAAQLVRRFLENAPSPDPSFGALELGIEPPFGAAGED